MKVTKAIELLSSHAIPMRTQQDHDLLDAVQLGIEALKRIKDRRAIMLSLLGSSSLWEDTPLPGETPEEDRKGNKHGSQAKED